jgi:hypothetical protein
MLSAIDAPDRAAVFGAAQEVAQERTDVAAALLVLANRLHDAARRAAGSSDLAAASLCSRRASLVLDAEVAVTMHNAHGQLTIEDLLFRMRAA